MANLRRGLALQGIRSRFSGGNNSNLSGFLPPVVGALVSLILTHFILHEFFPNVYEAWMWSFAFKFMIACIIIALIMKKKDWLTDFWYYTIIGFLPIACILIQFIMRPVEGKDPEVNKNSSPVKTSDTTYTKFDSRFITHLEPYQQYRIDGLGPNEEVVISGTGEDGLRLKQVQRTDSLGVPEIIPLLLTPGQQFKAGETIVFTHTKGYSQLTLKRFF